MKYKQSQKYRPSPPESPDPHRARKARMRTAHEPTVVVLRALLLEVVVAHAQLVQAGPVQLRQQVQPQRHLVAAVVALRLGARPCISATLQHG